MVRVIQGVPLLAGISRNLGEIERLRRADRNLLNLEGLSVFRRQGDHDELIPEQVHTEGPIGETSKLLRGDRYPWHVGRDPWRAVVGPKLTKELTYDPWLST